MDAAILTLTVSKALNILYPIWCILGFVALAVVFVLSIIRGGLL